MQLKGAAFPYRRDPVLLAENSLHGRLPVLYWQETSPPAVSNMTEAGETTLEPKTALSVRNLSVFSFWTQLSLSVVSGIILFFSVQSGTVRACRPCTPKIFFRYGSSSLSWGLFSPCRIWCTARACFILSLEQGLFICASMPAVNV